MRATGLAAEWAVIEESVLEVFALNVVPNIGSGLVAKISTQSALILAGSFVSNNVLQECGGILLEAWKLSLF